MRKATLGLLALGGAVVGFLALKGREFGMRRRVARAVGIQGRRSLRDLKGAILGASRGAVAAVFGPPRAMVSPAPGAKMRDYWYAETWYYPLDVERRTGVAIRFRDDTAEAVDFIAGPGAGGA